MPTLTGSNRVARLVNSGLLLNLVRQRGGVSRAQLAQASSLTPAAVSKIVNQLLAAGLLTEEGEAESRGGRRAVILKINPSGGLAVGVDIGRTHLRLSLLNLAAEVVAEVVYPKALADSPAAVVSQIALGFRELLERFGGSTDRLRGIGVAVPGPVDSVRGMVLLAPNLPGWSRVELGPMLQERLGLPVQVEKDANAAAVAEHWFGNGQGIEDLLYILVDEGIGSGVIIRGELYRGHDHIAGELGHVSINVDGPRCHCGNYGCLGLYTSGAAIRQKALTAIKTGFPSRLSDVVGPDPDQLTSQMVVEAAAQGDELSRGLLAEAGRFLGLALVNSVNLYNPALVILGGKLVEGTQEILENASRLAADRFYPALQRKVQVRAGAYGVEAPAVGAAALILQRVFRPLRITAHR